MRELEYPFDPEWILRKRKHIKKTLLAEQENWTKVRIAVLGGMTTHDIIDVLELFLLNYGIKPAFYESEYNLYYEDAMFPNPGLEEFSPELLYICTSNRNIQDYPVVSDTKEEVSRKLSFVFSRFEGMWEHITKTYHCPIIQNNFDLPFYRLLGNQDAVDIHGRVHFINRLNLKFAEYAQEHENFYIHDLCYESADYGLKKWADPYYWHMYKYAMSMPAIPYLAFHLSNQIKAIYGKNKKVLMLDLDNTLWGGVVGDDGADNIEIGQETSIGQTYSEFQEYVKAHRDLGVLLAVNSKNEEAAALSGLSRPDSVLKAEDFVVIKANWENKDRNLLNTASELNLLPESFVFVDDNPAEREIVLANVPGCAVPEIDEAEHFIQILDRSGFFEVTRISEDDKNRSQMYQANVRRANAKKSFADYGEYLLSLQMHAEIQNFIPAYMARIAQLTNKSNQFNLTTKRYSQSEIEAIAANPAYITLYGKLEDKFGDNGVVSVVIGRIDGEHQDELHVELWLMSCRVLKRNLEYAMMDELVLRALDRGIRTIYGYYYPTEKNTMVKDFYRLQGFEAVSFDDNGNAVWKFEISKDYKYKQSVITVNDRTLS